MPQSFHLQNHETSLLILLVLRLIDCDFAKQIIHCSAFFLECLV